jgi:hypothetical protein
MMIRIKNIGAFKEVIATAILKLMRQNISTYCKHLCVFYKEKLDNIIWMI